MCLVMVEIVQEAGRLCYECGGRPNTVFEKQALCNFLGGIGAEDWSALEEECQGGKKAPGELEDMSLKAEGGVQLSPPQSRPIEIIEPKLLLSINFNVSDLSTISIEYCSWNRQSSDGKQGWK